LITKYLNSVFCLIERLEVTCPWYGRIFQKITYQSAQQAEDIKNLTAIENMDWSYIKKWVSKLNLKTFELLPS
jgi:hypothetical protein